MAGTYIPGPITLGSGIPTSALYSSTPSDGQQYLDQLTGSAWDPVPWALSPSRSGGPSDKVLPSATKRGAGTLVRDGGVGTRTAPSGATEAR